MNASPAGGFSIRQIDPVEAKVAEIRALLQTSDEPPLDPNMINCYITRETLVASIELYGKHWQPNVPLLHMATFDVTHASPILLSAILLVGACYSESLMPPGCIMALGVRLGLAIESQPHERNMEEPPLSTIQASVLLRPVLVLSRDASSYKFASLHFARTISVSIILSE